MNPGICLSDVSRGAGHGCQVQGTGVEYSKSSLIHRAKTGGGGKEQAAFPQTLTQLL